MKILCSFLAICAVQLPSLSVVQGGKILVSPLDGSHWVNMKVLIEELHLRGHDITVIRASNSWYIKEKSPFYTSVTIPTTGGFDVDFFGTIIAKQLEMRKHRTSLLSEIWFRYATHVEMKKQMSYFHQKMSEMAVQILEDKPLMQSLNDSKYDLVLADPGIGVGAILAHRLQLPLVFNVRWTIHGEAHFVIAPSPLSYIPFTATELTDKMTFPQRIKNVLSYIIGVSTLASMTYPYYNPVVRHYFGSDVDYFALFNDADIWLMRNDFIFEFPRPTMPNVVYMGGFQCKPPEPLPEDLEDFVQSSGQHGVVIMSLGTLVAELPEDIAEEIAYVFAQLPQKVIWRYSGQRPTNLGNNTLLVDWLPQKDLLGHHKTRAFVAHGGTNGVQEAIYYGVPVLGLPLAFDQHENLFRLKVRGGAQVLDISTLDRNIFGNALKSILHDSSYSESMQKLSRLHRDQPMKPLDRAIFWIEFVIRHKGASHLKAQANKMSWFVYYSVDVIAFLLAISLFLILAFIYIIRSLWRKILGEKKIKKA